MKNIIRLIAFVAVSFVLKPTTTTAQIFKHTHTYTHQDTLRGSITAEREWWDLNYYHLDIFVNPADSSITGSNTIRYKKLEENNVLQVDLQPPMRITKVEQNGVGLAFSQNGNAYFVEVDPTTKIGEYAEIKVYYEGRPQVSKRPPWSGGMTWKYDKNNKLFAATSVQGDGASLFWPCKDHMYDEPDSMLISVRVPEGLMDVSNGRLRKQEKHKDGSNTTHWFVSNPINNYGVNLNIADYVHFGETYDGEKGKLDVDYYVLKEDLEKAKKHFSSNVNRMLEAFEHWFGPYPFYEDGFKLVQTPYLGMEHQSSVTYGNGFQNGYLGRDLSQTGWGLKWDFIIIHESGHEWFANNITYKDVADMWVHEGFTSYSESLFTEYFYGKEAGLEYVRGCRSSIQNDIPIIGIYDVNQEGSGDMYSKGANMLNTIRQITNNDEAWRNMLRGLNKTFYHETVTTEQIENFVSESLGHDFSKVFDQYLRDIRIPVLEYRVFKDYVAYRWSNTIDGFDMPVDVQLNGKELRIKPSRRWNQVKFKGKFKSFELNPNYYIGSMDLQVK